MAGTGRHLVYSVTKTFLGVLCLRLQLDLDASVRTWIADERLPDVPLRRLLNHTAGIPDYARLPAYAEAVRTRPSDPWDDEELVARALAHGPDFAPGEGWAYSNTGFLLVRRIVDEVAPGGFAGALERELLGPLGLTETALALELDDLRDLVPARSSEVGEGEHDVRGRYHPCWVGHRTLASTVEDQRRFWTALARGDLCDLDVLAESVDVGHDEPGFVRPGYGLGVMTDREFPGGPLLGHGGSGPGYVAAALALVRDDEGPLVAVELSGDERADVLSRALEGLRPASGA